MPGSLPQEREPRLCTGSRPTEILARTRPILVGHPVDLATAQPAPRTTAKSKPTPPLAQHSLRQLRAPDSDSGRRRARRGHGGRPRRPRPSQPYGGLPHRRAPRPHFGRTQRTPDSGHLDAQMLAPDTGHRLCGQARVDTGRSHRTVDAWTLAEDADRVTTARPASGLLLLGTTPSDRALGRPTVFLWTVPTAPSAHAGSAVGPAFQREIALALPSSCLIIPPGPSGASAHCCPRTIFGSSVEPTAKLHPLWRVHSWGCCEW